MIKSYKCDFENCNWQGLIRTRIKDKDSVHYGKYFCPLHASKFTPKKAKAKDNGSILIKKNVRDVYFTYHILNCTRSEESGTPIYSPSRFNICHLVDKGRHPSVQGCLDNCIYLTAQEHQRLDDLLFTHRFSLIEKEFKNSWKIICERYKKVLPLCTERTKFYFAISEYLDLI